MTKQGRRPAWTVLRSYQENIPFFGVLFDGDGRAAQAVAVRS
jgi:hypothetical protein